MSDRLSDLFHGHEVGLEAGAAGAVMDEVARAQVLRRARGARRARASFGAVAVAAALAVVGGAAFLLTRPEPLPPSTSTSPAPSPSGSPVSSPSESALPDPGFAGTVTVDPHLPSAAPVTPEVWAEAGPGWVLVSYQERAYLGGEPLGPQLVYLISPDGVRFELTPIAGQDVISVIAWRPQETSALVWTRPGDGATGEARWARLDLVSGAVSPAQVDAPVPVSARPLGDGRVGVGDGLAVDAYGTVTSVETAATATVEAGEAVHPGYTCADIGSYSDRSSLLMCRLADAVVEFDDSVLEPLLVRAWSDGRVETISEPRPGTDPEPLVWQPGNSVVDDVPIVVGSDEWSPYGCPTGRYAVQDGVYTLLPGVAASSFPEPNIFLDAGASGTATYTVVSAGCSGDAAPSALVRDDLATGDHVELVPYPTEGESTSASLLGYYVVP